MTAHDPREYVRGIHQILISDKKRIGFLFGAGSSFATGVSSVSVPIVQSITEEILKTIQARSAPFATAVKEIQTEVEATGTVFNVESLLSTLEAKRSVIG